MNKPSSEDPDPELTNNPAAPALTTTVTLSLPSAETKNVVDIVFVMDKSTSTKNSNIDFSETAMTFLQDIDDLGENVIVKVGVVKFKGDAWDAIGNDLVEYSASTKETIRTAIATNISDDVTYPSRGSNLDSGLVLAQTLLDGDKDVPNSNKYVIALTDGKNYIWYDDTKNQPMGIYS
ncbi:MAG: VWA domain-containing protein, partial [Eubacteriaceae bacterium]|nr:VWA domain-containing protein [Eubacteriaceae bacterium]